MRLIPILIGLLALPCVGEAQALPRACTALLRDSTVQHYHAWPESNGGELDSLLVTLLPLPDQHSSFTLPDSIRVIWKHDSSATMTALARLGSSLEYPRRVSWSALRAYRALGAPPEPMLTRVLDLQIAAYQTDMLRMIDPPLSLIQERVVLSMACNAGWQLTAFKADPPYAAAWKDAGSVGWPFEAAAFLDEAVRLLSGDRRTVATVLRAQVPRNWTQAE